VPTHTHTHTQRRMWRFLIRKIISSYSVSFQRMKREKNPKLKSESLQTIFWQKWIILNGLQRAHLWGPSEKYGAEKRYLVHIEWFQFTPPYRQKTDGTWMIFRCPIHPQFCGILTCLPTTGQWGAAGELDLLREALGLHTTCTGHFFLLHPHSWIKTLHRMLNTAAVGACSPSLFRKS
jgi:hypothetical protein